MNIIYNLKQQQNPQCAFSLQDGLKKSPKVAVVINYSKATTLVLNSIFIPHY